MAYNRKVDSLAKFGVKRPFGASFDADLERIRKIAVESARDIAKAAYRKIVRSSPIWAGDYIRSHRIGIGGPSDEPPCYEGRDSMILVNNMVDDDLVPPEASMAQKMAFRQEAEKRIGALNTYSNLRKKIHLTNAVSHCNIVEFLGTPKVREGYHVYTSTASWLFMVGAQDIIDKVEARHK